ncbi:MAG: ABC transporter permease, partial [Clostridia bacterium]|nr:ABC transporter permease [Clostridia bacterium]
MTRYLVKRLLMMVVTLFMIALLTFVLMHVVPGGPFTMDKQVPKAVLEALNEKYKLNDPLWKQFLDYMGGLIRLELGPSFKYQGKTVNDFINNGLPFSATLG